MPDGIRPEAGSGRDAGGRPVSAGRDQSGDLFQRKRKYDGLRPTEMRRLKELEDENAKLRQVVADLSLAKEMLQDVIRRKL
jgi:hypothetical protein